MIETLMQGGIVHDVDQIRMLRDQKVRLVEQYIATERPEPRVRDEVLATIAVTDPEVIRWTEPSFALSIRNEEEAAAADRYMRDLQAQLDAPDES